MCYLIKCFVAVVFVLVFCSFVLFDCLFLSFAYLRPSIKISHLKQYQTAEIKRIIIPSLNKVGSLAFKCTPTLTMDLLVWLVFLFLFFLLVWLVFLFLFVLLVWLVFLFLSLFFLFGWCFFFFCSSCLVGVSLFFFSLFFLFGWFLFLFFLLVFFFFFFSLFFLFGWCFFFSLFFLFGWCFFFSLFFLFGWCFFFSFFFFFPPPRWPSGLGVHLGGGRSGDRIPVATGFFRGRVIPVT